MPVKAVLIRKAALSDTGTTTDNRTAAQGLDSLAAAMDCALALEKRQPHGRARWNEHVIELAWSVAPVICELFSLAVKVCVELEMNWLSWALPGTFSGSAAQLGSSADPAAGERQEQWTESLARGMDVAIGVEAEKNPVELSSTGGDLEGQTLPPIQAVRTVPRRAKSAAASNAA